MGTSSFLDRMLSNLRETSRYYTGHPKEFGPSRIIQFTSERQFVQLLHEGQPVVVAFTINQVECPKYPGFCIARQRKDYPFIEIFHSPEEAANQAKVADANITKYSVKVLPFNYDISPYGFREFFKKHEMLSSKNK
ncbi:hypothetical protein KFK09_018380 [Dendrobium nobile]|uniref:Uncharacterized protein n=1 Tax=Dendrobium nobile TaxID=94219 RepID=A0A8T3AVN9_DENNO|nr:hypothetical protein KFK09_018380 [Dendrobium nobile]